MGSTVDDMQVGCLWLGENLITVSLSGVINYLDRACPETPQRIIKVSHRHVLLCPFPYLGSTHQVVILQPCASSLSTSFCFVSFRIISFHLSFHVPNFQCPLPSIFHVLITVLSVYSQRSWKSILAVQLMEFFDDIFSPSLSPLSGKALAVNP